MVNINIGKLFFSNIRLFLEDFNNKDICKERNKTFQMKINL